MFSSSFGRCKHSLRLVSNFRRGSQRGHGSSSRPFHASSLYRAFPIVIGFSIASWTLFLTSQTRMDEPAIDPPDSSNRAAGLKPPPGTQKIFNNLIQLWHKAARQEETSNYKEIIGQMAAIWLYEYARRQPLEQKSTVGTEVLLILFATQLAQLCTKPEHCQSRLEKYYDDQEKMTEEFAELQNFYLNQITGNMKDIDISSASRDAKAVILGLIATQYIRVASEGAFETSPGHPESLPEVEYVQSFQKSRYRRLERVEKVMIYEILGEAIAQVLLKRRPRQSKERKDLVEELARLGFKFDNRVNIDLLVAGSLSIAYLRAAKLW